MPFMSVQTRRHRSSVFAFFNLLMVAATTAVFAVCWYHFYRNTANQLFLQKGNWLVIFIGMVLYVSFARLYEGFHVTASRILEVIYSQAVATLMTGFLMYLILWLLKGNIVPPNPLPLLVACACDIVIAGIWAFLVKRYSVATSKVQRAAILYKNQASYHNGKNILKRIPMKLDVVIEEDVSDKESRDVIKKLQDQQVDMVMICGVPSSYRNDILKYCMTNDIVCYVRPTIGDSLMEGGNFQILSHLPVVRCQRATPGLIYLFTKRLVDIVLSLIAIILLSPLLLITALAIKLYDHGPVLYKQKRMTINRKVFNILKFRTMKVDADKGGKGIVTMQNDDRITPVGKKIRPFRIDELPQLFNILKGDMTIVGPRPERIETIELYEKETPEFALRLQVKAGLSGFAAVYGKANTEPYDKLQMDLYYINHLSLANDLKIIFATVKAIFLPESTEGFEKEKNALSEQR